MKLLIKITMLSFIGFISSLKAQEKLYLNTFPLENVRLLEGPFKKSRDLNIEVLLKYDTDRFLAPYRKEAGLEPKAKPYPNWEGLDGHVGGHYLSALAINYAATGNKECKDRMDYMVKELKECWQANAKNNLEWGVNYVGGFPNSASIWGELKKGNLKPYRSAWAPWYNLHKMYAGLRDAWLYADVEDAKFLFLKFCDWGIALTENLSEKQMQQMLDMEHGGINESYADAYQISGDTKYLDAAKRFSHKALLDPFSEGVDNLDNKHANTQIPKFVGFERIAQLDENPHYDDAANFFWETVVENRTLAFGGNSRKEHFPTVEASVDYITESDGPESCNSYNMLKLTEDLFRNHPEVKYVDYYENTLYNHILSTQHPDHGGYVYFTPTRPRHYRAYSAPNEAMWCCVGTGMENHGKYNQFIYTHSKDSLFVNLFIPSKLTWQEKNVELVQETSFPESDKTTLKISKGKSKFRLLIRYPGWVKKGELKITVNGKDVQILNSPSSYVSLERVWKKGDRVEVTLPMKNSIKTMPNIPQYVAFFHGPILLGAKTGTEDLKGLIADDSRFGQHTGGKKLPIGEAPILIDDDVKNINDRILKGDKPLHFKLDVDMVNPISVDLQPFYKIHDSRYMMYWLALSKNGYESYLDSLSTIDKKRIALERRSADFVATGEQQPESDHFMKTENSNFGYSNGDFWREAHNGGFFSYEMKTNGHTDLNLWVSYWGFEWGGRKFQILIDGELLIEVDNTNRWKINTPKNLEYPIPKQMLKGKEKVRVSFKSKPRETSSAIYGVRFVKQKT